MFWAALCSLARLPPFLRRAPQDRIIAVLSASQGDILEVRWARSLGVEGLRFDACTHPHTQC